MFQLVHDRAKLNSLYSALLPLTLHLYQHRALMTYLLGLLHHSDILHYVPSTIWHYHRGHHSFLPKQKCRRSGWGKHCYHNRAEGFLSMIWEFFFSLECVRVCMCVCRDAVMWKPHGRPLSSWLNPSNFVLFVVRKEQHVTVKSNITC